jgi:1-acyl-sn-glycerol-3-phosphate acyltransferase
MFMMEENTQSFFDDIRAYHDEEIPAVVEKIASDPLLIPAAQFVFPNLDIEQVRNLISSCRTTDDIQRKIMYPAIGGIIHRTMRKFTTEGCGNISDTNGWLFVSNHRDITLDAMLMQYALFDNNLPTTDISLGDNLLRTPLVFELCKANYMIKVIRKDDVSMREFLENSRHLSEYIRHRISDVGRSVWIAQRNGRTKDGIDMTEPGIIKMFGLSGSSDFVENFSQLHIAPVAISYQYEPCDVFKAVELCRRQNGTPYHKAENEDFLSILTGIKAYKGDANLTFCEPITTAELESVAALPRAEQCKALAEIMDVRITKGYKLYDTNYIAYDIKHGTRRFERYYTAAAEQQFALYLVRSNAQFEVMGVDKDAAREILLGIYANPVEAKLNLGIEL